MGEKEQITHSLTALVEKSGGSIVVEAGHFYADQGINDKVSAGVQIASTLIDLIVADFQITPDRMVLVDDIGAKFEPFMLPAMFSGYQMILESSLIEAGNQALVELKSQGLTKEHKGRQHLKKGWLPLQGKAGISHHPACEVLDAVLYQQKLNDWGGTITVLPQGYRSQQGKTQKIYQALTGEEKPNVLVIYHNQQAEITDIDYWG